MLEFFLGPSFGGFFLSLASVTLAVSEDESVGFSLSAFAGGRVELIGGRKLGRGVDVGSAVCSFGGNLGAVRTFHSGFAFGACLPLEAETLMKS